jgi:type IV secretion system protein VirD4
MHSIFSRNAVVLLAGALVLLECISFMTFQLLGLPNTPLPWSFLFVLQHHIFFEPLISVAIGILFTFIGWGIIQGGLMRYLGGILMAIVLGIALTAWLGIFIYQWVEGIEALEMVDIYSLLMQSLNGSSASNHFLLSEAASFSLVLMGLGFIFFESVRPANKVLGNAHFANGLEIHQGGFYKKKRRV